jgi:hypothetical protein
VDLEFIDRTVARPHEEEPVLDWVGIGTREVGVIEGAARDIAARA